VPPIGTEPVLYPVPAQTGVPLAFPGREVPDPLPNAPDKMGGYPITVTFPLSVRVPDARAWLEDETGKEVPVWFSSPTSPDNDDFVRHQANTICLFAKELLQPGMRYVVRVEAKAGTAEWSRTWTFSTHPAEEWQRRMRDYIVPRLNHFRKASGLAPMAIEE